MDFQRMILDNNKPIFISLEILEKCDIVMTFSKVKRKYKSSFLNLSKITN